MIALMTMAILLGPGLDQAKEETVDSKGVKLHAVTLGGNPSADGADATPLVVLIHGFPDFWYSWREQMPALAERFKVVAYDQRAFNKSDKPEGVEQYTMDKLVDDCLAVVDHFKAKKAVIVGHDWGGMVAWSFAMKYPERTDRLIICNLPHPNGLMRELKNNPDQRRNSAYARNFQKPDAAKNFRVEMIIPFLGIKEKEVRDKYIEALKGSSLEGMLNYYKANYPREPYELPKEPLPKVKCRVLMFHGLKDTALMSPALNGTWDWVEQDLTLVTIPSAGHWVQKDAADQVTKTMVSWLTAK